MRVVCAPDSFKHSLSAAQAAAAMARGVRAAHPDAEAVEVPMSDGGEGFTDAIADALGARIVEVAVPDAWAGQTVGALDVRRKFGLNVLAVKRQGKLNANVTSDTMLLHDETVLVLGSNQAIQRCFHL